MGPKSIWLFQFLFLFAASSSSSSPSPLLSPFSPPTFANDHLCVHEERSALLQFKHMFTIDTDTYVSFKCNLSGPPSYPKTVSWNESARSDCCSWDGVTCDWLTGHVIGLDLSCSQLYGTIHPNSSLFRLSHLRRLNLAYNDFNRSHIPSHAFGILSFASLTHLNLSYSNFAGSIPSEISHLSKLVSLDLSSIFYDRLSLEPHPFRILLKNLTRLQELALSGARISSVLPDSLTNLSSLVALDLSSTRLQGNLPDKIFHLPNLQRLILGNNLNLSVTLPKVSRPRGWSSLRELDLSKTNSSGTLPDSIGYFKSLNYLSLWGTSLSGELPDSIGYLKSLSTLDLSYCFFSGAIPKSLWNLTQISQLDLSDNSLQGPLPIPPLSTQYFSISNNNLSGEIHSSICSATSLELLDLSHNNLSGAIPRCLGNFSSVLSVLDLRSNAFQGAIPLTFAKDNNSLRNLNLNGNQFEGVVPRSLTNCRSLEVLDLGNNRFNDTFPYWLGTLPELQVLVLRSNKFHGLIDTSEPENPFPSLRIVDLSHNKFTGQLPRRYFEKFQAMKNETTPSKKYMGDDERFYNRDSVEVTMKGIEIELVRILTIFAAIDLSSNNFSGEIPDVVGSLNSLIVLNLSHNSLASHIPGSLGDLTRLESLDLSSNQLTGPIPSQLMNLTFLEVLNLSQNHLDGPIPREKQFGTFGNESYGGNSGLCGFPLTKECADNQTQQLGQEEDDSEYESGFTWEVVAMGYGCGVVFGLLMGGLMFLIGRPRFFVRIVEVERPRKKIRFN